MTSGISDFSAYVDNITSGITDFSAYVDNITSGITDFPAYVDNMSPGISDSGTYANNMSPTLDFFERLPKLTHTIRYRTKFFHLYNRPHDLCPYGYRFSFLLFRFLYFAYPSLVSTSLLMSIRGEAKIMLPAEARSMTI